MSNKLSAGIQNAAFSLLCAMPLLLAITRAGADITVCAIGGFFLFRCATSKNWRWAERADIRAMFALWLYIALQSLILSDAASFYRVFAWVRFIVFYAAITAWLLTSDEKLRKLAGATFFTVCLLMIDTYWQYIYGVSLTGRPYPHENRLGGPMTHPNIANLLLKVTLPVAGIWLVLSLERKKPLEWGLLACLGLLFFALVLISGERSSSLLMLLAILIISSGIFLSIKRYRLHVVLGLALLGLLITTLIYTQPVVNLRTLHLIEQTFNLKSSVYGQLFVSAFNFWKVQPLFGIGVGQFKFLCEPSMPIFMTTYCDVHPHNIYFEWLSETGIIGVGLFMIAMGFAIKWMWCNQSVDSNRLVLLFPITALCVLLWPAIVTQSIFSNWPAMLFWYSLSVSVCAPRIVRKI